MIKTRLIGLVPDSKKYIFLNVLLQWLGMLSSVGMILTITTISLRENKSYVTQDTHLFHDSIERNLRIADPDASHEQVVEACKKASVHDFIMTLPKGYDTEVAELGETLSGGERQRIGIARAFLHEPTDPS